MADVFIIGDSHAGAIRNAFVSRGWNVCGGPIRAGKVFEQPFFEEHEGLITFLDPVAQRNFSNALAKAGVTRVADLNMPVVITLGFNSGRLAKVLSTRDARFKSLEPPTWSRAVLEASVGAVKAAAVDFCKMLPAERTFAVLSPRRVRLRHLSLFDQIERIYADKLVALGIRIIDVADQTSDSAGLLREEFWSLRPDDRWHANEAFASIVVDRIIQLCEREHAPDNVGQGVVS